MTMHMTKADQMAAFARLKEEIESRLKYAGPEGLTVREIGDGLPCMLNTVRKILNHFEDIGIAYRERHAQPGRQAIYHTYHATMPAFPEADGPRRITSYFYPVTIRRDWAVEALFGPARKEAA